MINIRSCEYLSLIPRDSDRAVVVGALKAIETLPDEANLRQLMRLPYKAQCTRNNKLCVISDSAEYNRLGPMLYNSENIAHCRERAPAISSFSEQLDTFLINRVHRSTS